MSDLNFTWTEVTNIGGQTLCLFILESLYVWTLNVQISLALTSFYRDLYLHLKLCWGQESFCFPLLLCLHCLFAGDFWWCICQCFHWAFRESTTWFVVVVCLFCFFLFIYFSCSSRTGSKLQVLPCSTVKMRD